ncbi:putative 39S ribosomal protein L43, mitochondrial [Hypsibius exemplaris]|uniref:Large ribosomal subunit protein mL43 n=1 Tax=Hypsibius exemplaris TaxID=2072580 RepID=A0A1W0X8G7_HYPEX|nr:putative 39S ribosomal protein L43, mitochondrial [Hypsibius exemplaris]
MPADPSGFLTAVLHNGVGRFVCQLQRITLKFCKEYGSSRGVREFIEKDLLDFARQNPGVVVYVEPKRHQRPKLEAEYLNGRTEVMNASEYSREQVIKFVEQLRCRSGVEIVRIRKDMRTNNISIQGPWHPFLNQPTEWNLKKFPDAPGLRALKMGKSATDIVLEMAREQGVLNIVQWEGKDPAARDDASGKGAVERTTDQVVRPVTAPSIKQ